jgi:phage/plasmid-associated DNA primase
MTKQTQALKPGEIKLDLISKEWPLTPLGANKDPYIIGWQNKPCSVHEIETEILTGQCKAIGLLSGPVFNLPYGLVWVDVDGPSVYNLIEGLADGEIDKVLPKTLTILSGKIGRERKLYRLDREKHKHFVRNKYTWHAETEKEKLEILWKKHQGVLMGLHPDTEGYYTAQDEGFEWIDSLPELPDWILNCIINKNVKQGIPATEKTRIVGPGFAVNAEINLERDIQLATEAMWAMPPEACDDYDIWITVGQSLHSLDDSLLDTWDEWSKQSEKYKAGECIKRWKSFDKGGARTLGSLIHHAKEYGWQPSQDHKVINREIDEKTLEELQMMLSEFDSFSAEPKVVNKRKIAPAINKGKEQKPRNPSSDIIANILIQSYDGCLRYSQAQDCFLNYNYRSEGLWSALSDTETKGEIKSRLELLKDQLLPNGYSMNLVNDVLEQLRITLIHDEWYEGNDYLLFTNGILELATRQLIPFRKDMYMTQQLPYQYDASATCEPIIKWLKHVQDNSWGRVQVLRAWLRAVLLSHSDIQKFVEIVGPGKSGKSTYSNLAHALVGDTNAIISSLDHLEKSRFETANLYKKKLLLFNDVERYGGSVSVLKAITGRDLIRNERKFQSGSLKPFKFNGLVMITANEPIQTTDPTSGLARRRLTIPFDRPFTGSSAQQRTLIDMDDSGNPFGDFAKLLPGLVNWLLDMNETDMREYLMETNQKVSFFAKHHREQILKSNQIMDWMDHCLIFDPGSSAPVGLAKNSQPGSSNIYVSWDKWLYASYCEFSRGSNSNILGRSRFETLLMDVCIHQLRLNIYKFKDRRGMRVKNISCRSSDQKYSDYPSIIEVGLNKEKWRKEYGDIIDKKEVEEIEEV